jgi:hypothetical protein
LLTSGSPQAQGVADLLARVTAGPTTLQITIKQEELLTILTSQSNRPPADEDQGEYIFEVPFAAAPAGGSSKLVFESQDAKTPDPVVVKAIARASVWFEQLTTGRSQSMAEIAVRENITDNYVSNLIHLAWLSPDLVGQVLDGDAEATALARAAMLTRKSDILRKRG